jgi:hypothetical protein
MLHEFVTRPGWRQQGGSRLAARVELPPAGAGTPLGTVDTPTGFFRDSAEFIGGAVNVSDASGQHLYSPANSPLWCTMATTARVVMWRPAALWVGILLRCEEFDVVLVGSHLAEEIFQIIGGRL